MRCESCPVRSGDCLGEKAPALCARAQGDGRFRAHLVGRAKLAGAKASPDPAAPDAWLAPLRDPATGGCLPSEPWRGRGRKKADEYEVTAAIVHLDAPKLLEAVIATLRGQTVRPYILVVDAGSLGRHRPGLDRIEAAEDVEFVYLRPKSWVATSQPVAAAMDCAFAMAQTRYVYATHVDVFLKRPDYVGWLLAQCGPATPAVGYQMSPRPASGNDWWTRTLSHTASIYHMPTMRRLGASWSMLAAFGRAGLEPRQPHYTGWPDTETHLGMVLHDAGVGVRWPGDPEPGPDDPPSVLMIGREPNEPYEDGNLVHARSRTSKELFARPKADAEQAFLDRALADTAARVRSWTLDRIRECPDRGSVLPVSRQPGCRCGELTECRAGRGRTPGAVTLAECLRCAGGAT